MSHQAGCSSEVLLRSSTRRPRACQWIPPANKVLTCSAVTASDFYHKKASALGPDPLREDADAEKLWLRMHNSKKPVGLMLMDQTAVAGVGNIYRAEILFKVQTTFAGLPGKAARRL